jgi:hypothetical protein
MKLADLVVGIGANTKSLDDGLGKARRKLKAFGRNTKQLGKDLSVGITAPLALMGATSINAFREQAKAIAQVEAGLKSTGNQVGYTSKQLQQMASDLQSKTLFGDEQILKDATAQLLTFTNISGDQFARTQEAALDLATRLDGDLKSASIQLGKALNDPVANLSALSRSGIQFSDDQKAVINSLAETGRLAEAQTLILDELNKQYGGSAEAAAKADGGFTQLANAFGDLQESIGAVLVPLLRPLVEKLREIVEAFGSMDQKTKGFAVVIAGIAAAIGPLLFLLPQLAGALGLLTGPIGLTIGAIALLATAIYKFSDEVGQALAPVINWFISLYNESTLVRIAIGHIKGMVKVVFDFFGFAINTVIEGLKDVGAVLKAVFTGDLGAVPGLVSDAFSRAADRMAEFGRKAAEDYKASVENELARDPIELVTPESISEGIKSLGGLRDAFDALFAGGGGGAGDTSGQKQMASMHKAVQEALQPAQLMAGGGPIAAMADGVDSAIGRMDERIMGFKNTMMDMYDALSQGAAQFGNEMGHAFGAMAQGAEDGKERMKEATKGIINQSLAAAQASIIEAMINSGKFTGPAAPIVIPALVATGIGLVQSLFSSIPAFEDGGIVSGPTLGLMGEYPGARSNPEVIAPLDKLQGMLQASPVVVTGRISGNDIRLSNDRSNRNAKRFLR